MTTRYDAESAYDPDTLISGRYATIRSGRKPPPVFTVPMGWAEPWNRLGDWQASSESSRARKSNNLISPFYTKLRQQGERPCQAGRTTRKALGIKRPGRF